MADLDWPVDLAPYVQAFYLQPFTMRSESPWTRQGKVYVMAAPRWITRMSFRGGYDGTVAQGAFGRRLDAFIARLEGGANRVRIWDFRRPGSALALTNEAVTAGDQTVTFTGASDGDILIGEYVGGDGRAHIVVSTAEVAGDLVATVMPPFADDIAEGDMIFERAASLFRLTSDDAGANATEVGGLTGYDLEFVEDLSGPTEVTFDTAPLTYSG